MTRSLRLAAVVNPTAGGDIDRVMAAMVDADPATVDVLTTTAAGDAADLVYKLAANERPPDIIIAVGGDGTVCEVVTGLHRARGAGAAVPPLLVAPAGTGNSTYRGLWNDEPWQTVARRALRGQATIRTIDLARIEHNDHIVVLGSGSGLFAETLLAIRGRAEKGRELLMAAALAAMAARTPYPGRVTVDGRTCFEGGVIETIVGGFRYRGGLLQLVPESVVDDGLLDITVVTAEADMDRFAQAAVRGAVYEVPGIRWARGSRMTVERLDGRPMLFEHDGEVMPHDRPAYDIRVLPAALDVLTLPDPPPWFGRVVTE